jgi:biotin-(acetyl-CoA carboxylase) ligase
VLEQWKGFDLMRDADVELDLGGESIRGIACGINDMGALQLKRKNGDIKSYYSGDLSLRLAQ